MILFDFIVFDDPPGEARQAPGEQEKTLNLRYN
jgi:hypothetical protein